MISAAYVSGYQSIDTLDLELAPFTVITGPSSSGKSALIRAIRSVATYQRGSAFISAWRGPRDGCTVTLDLPEATVTVHRAHDSARNTYTVAPPGVEPSRYTKLAGAVPDPVTALLRIPPESSLQLALQFDPPYLLAASPAEAHATLARLTGVTTILTAAREANRRRLGHLNTSKALQRELDATRETLDAEPYASLDARTEAADAVAHRLAALVELQLRHAAVIERRTRLHTATDRVRAARATLDLEAPTLDRLHDLEDRHHKILSTRTRWITARTEALALTAAASRQAPDLERLVDVAARRDAIAAAVERLRDAQARITAWQDKISGVDVELETSGTEHAEALAALTVCPTCGRPYDEETVHA